MLLCMHLLSLDYTECDTIYPGSTGIGHISYPRSGFRKRNWNLQHSRGDTKCRIHKLTGILDTLIGLQHFSDFRISYYSGELDFL